ncbi:MAG: hypothetical protein KF752_10030 [Pirellulaceae bacterium]|nr:hypothetical protein [Pirellulaceae bacterium]
MQSEKTPMSAPVHAVVMPPCEHGALAILVEVPFSDRWNACDDVAEAYAVEVGDDIPGGCIIWGRYHRKWQPNVSGRWLVSRFIRGASRMLHSEQRGGDDWGGVDGA